METIGLPELLVIGIIAVVLFGGAKIPELGKGIGEAMKNFKASLKDPQKETDKTPEKV
jgi:sec-independent protein translocase protein TatA